jgi:hypothetical protein
MRVICGPRRRRDGKEPVLAHPAARAAAQRTGQDGVEEEESARQVQAPKEQQPQRRLHPRPMRSLWRQGWNRWEAVEPRVEEERNT